MGPQLVLAPLTRTMAEDQADRILELINSIPGQSWSRKELLAQRPDKFRYSRLWLSGSKVVGVVIASRKKEAVHIHQVALDNEYHRRGLGRRAYSEIAGLAASEGLSAITANCLKSDKGALDFHLALGFSSVGRYTDPDDGHDYQRLKAAVATIVDLGQAE